MSQNRLIIAAAGSGKTSTIINEIMDKPSERALITTFTLANESSIRQKLIEKNKGSIPQNVTVQTWFSFLIEHGVRPYRYWGKRVDGLKFVTNKSETGIKPFFITVGGKKIRPEWGEDENFDAHYFTSNMNIYSDKLSKLVVRCNNPPKDRGEKGLVIRRLSEIFDSIYIDEVQDMAGYDLEVIKLLLKSNIRITMVGDPRQTVYLTHHATKFSKYKEGKIKEFIESLNTKRKTLCSVDEETLKDSHRNSSQICELSSKLYPEFSRCESQLRKLHKHIGIYFIRESDAIAYGDEFSPLQLKLDKSISLFLPTQNMNFGESKGLEANHVLIYPTKGMLDWLKDNTVELAFKTRAQLYVALTRAFFSVGVVVPDNFDKGVCNIDIWSPS